MKNHRSGVTLIEILVVVAIIGVLVALLMPAVQSAREAARRKACQNNLHQIGLAVQGYESARKILPPLYNGTFLPVPQTPLDEFHYHSWRTAILDQLEEANVQKMLDLSLPATDPANQKGINAEIAVFLCPSTASVDPNFSGILQYNGGQIPTVVVGSATRSDYEAICGVEGRDGDDSVNPFLRITRYGVWGEPHYQATTKKSQGFRIARFRDVTDGLSKTLLVVERGGRPDVYKAGKLVEAYPYSPPTSGPDHHQAAWGISTHIAWLLLGTGQTVNETNSTGIYSFHPGGANVTMADATVNFLAESTDAAVLAAMATRAAGD